MRKKRPRLPRICMSLLGLLSAISAPAAMCTDVSACIDTATILPLLGGRGDSPIIPVIVGPRDAAMFLTFDSTSNMVWNTHDVGFPPTGGLVRFQKDDGTELHPSQTKLENFQIGQSGPSNIAAVLLDRAPEQSVAGRSIIGVLGREAFSHGQVLLDEPHGKLAFIEISDRKACASTEQDLLGGNAQSVPLMDGGIIPSAIPVTIDHKTRLAGLDPDLTDNAVPADWIDPSHLPAETLKTAPAVQTRYLDTMVWGKRIALPDYAIGDAPGHTMMVVVEPKILRAVLGAPFFAHRMVLFDYPNRRVLFQSIDTETLPPAKHLHFDISTATNVSVRNRMGQLK